MKHQTKSKSIAVVGPFSGPRAVYGEMLKKGVLRANVNIAKPLDLEFYDDMGDPLRAKAIAEEVTTSGKVAVVGHFNSFSALEALPIYKDAQIPLLLPASTNMNILSRFDNVLRFCANDELQIRIVKEYCLHHNLKTGILLHDQTSYGKDLYGLFLKSKGFLTIKEFSNETLKNVDFVYFAGTHYNAAHITKRLLKMNYQGAIFLSDDSYTDEFIQLLGKENAKNCLVVAAQEDYEQTSYLAIKYLIDNFERENYFSSIVEKIDHGFSSTGENIRAGWSLKTIQNKEFVEVNDH